MEIYQSQGGTCTPKIIIHCNKIFHEINHPAIGKQTMIENLHIYIYVNFTTKRWGNTWTYHGTTDRFGGLPVGKLPVSLRAAILKGFPRIGVPLVIIHIHRIFPYKQSIFGTPHDYGKQPMYLVRIMAQHIGGTPSSSWGYPHSWMVYKGKIAWKWMITGVPHLWNSPYLCGLVDVLQYVLFS